MKKILFATNGSRSSKKAEAITASILEAYPEAKLVVLHVIKTIAILPINIVNDASILPALSGQHDIDFAAVIKENIEYDFKEFWDRVKFVQCKGSPAIKICEVAHQEQVDLIIVGSHVRCVVDKVFWRSVTSAVLHRSHVPVLVVK